MMRFVILQSFFLGYKPQGKRSSRRLGVTTAPLQKTMEFVAGCVSSLTMAKRPKQMEEIMNWTISSLEKQGYEGSDRSLEISLFEYGLAWKLCKRATKGGFKKGEYKFIFGCMSDESGNYSRFDWAGNIHESTDPKEEWNWADFAAVAACCGMTELELLAQDIPRIVADMLGYYGRENVFGSTYYPLEIGSAENRRNLSGKE